jgi:hypothetical protein
MPVLQQKISCIFIGLSKWKTQWRHLSFPYNVAHKHNFKRTSCKANARVKTSKDGAQSALYHIICVVQLLFVLFYVVFVWKCVLAPGDNPIAVNKHIIIFWEHANCEDTVSVISKYSLYFEQNTWNLLYNIIQCPERTIYLRNAFQQNLQK